jgi:hypothetical protein
MQRYLRAALAVLLFAAVTVVSANAQSIPAEDDTWVTGSGTQVDLAHFGNINIAQLLGSLPNNSVITFTGVPLNSSLGQADTLVSRGSATVSSQFSATLSLKGLNLASISPHLTLLDGRVYNVTTTLANQNGAGSMTFTTTTSEGGTFSSSFTVTPIITLTNSKNSNDTYTIDCSSPTYACSFPIAGSGSWVLTSTTGFDPQSQGIPIVPSGVQVGAYTTVGKGRSGGIQVGCGGTKSTGYGCGLDKHLHGPGSPGQAIHGAQPPTDCATPSPSPTPTPVGGGGGCMSTTGNRTGCNATMTTTLTTTNPSPSPSPAPSPSPQPLCSN